MTWLSPFALPVTSTALTDTEVLGWLVGWPSELVELTERPLLGPNIRDIMPWMSREIVKVSYTYYIFFRFKNYFKLSHLSEKI